MMLTVGELRAALFDAPDDALLDFDVVLQGEDVVIGRSYVKAVSLSEPDSLGFRWCRIETEMPIADVLESKALEYIPPFILEKTVAKGKVSTIGDVENWICES